MTNKLRDAEQEIANCVALELERIAQESPVNGNELAQIRVLIAAANVRAFGLVSTEFHDKLRSALAQQGAQAVPQEPCAVADHDGLTAPIYTAPQSAILAGYKLADDERVAALCDLSYAAGMKAGWNFCVNDDDAGFERSQSVTGEAMRVLKKHRTMLAASPAKPAEQEPYCYTYTENGEEYFAPPTAYVPDDAKPLYTAPQPDKRVMLTDEEIAALPVWTHFVGLMTDSKSDIARAVIEAYERKNGIVVGRNVQEKQS